mmetsp:Transcript_12736/g.32549  ORF Transcript_12736/g.32549 Transcript_12736/m.32549 type:complete len:212 (-) Transcript_12736:1175-1810(-)
MSTLIRPPRAANVPSLVGRNSSIASSPPGFSTIVVSRTTGSMPSRATARPLKCQATVPISGMGGPARCSFIEPSALLNAAAAVDTYASDCQRECVLMVDWSISSISTLSRPSNDSICIWKSSDSAIARMLAIEPGLIGIVLMRCCTTEGWGNLAGGRTAPGMTLKTWLRNTAPAPGPSGPSMNAWNSSAANGSFDSQMQMHGPAGSSGWKE